MQITDHKIILASNSPRRKELLSGIDIEYEIRTIPDIEEDYPEEIPSEEIAEYLARKKASAYTNSLTSNELLITADTIVILNNKIYGKPVNKSDSIRMLRELSGQTHLVVTGVCLVTTDKMVSFSDKSKVTFGELTNEEIEYYADRYNPIDKAGAYGVQEWIGYVAVKHIEGSYFNIMGLPIYRVYEELKKWEER